MSSCSIFGKTLCGDRSFTVLRKSMGLSIELVTDLFKLCLRAELEGRKLAEVWKSELVPCLALIELCL